MMQPQPHQRTDAQAPAPQAGTDENNAVLFVNSAILPDAVPRDVWAERCRAHLEILAAALPHGMPADYYLDRCAVGPVMFLGFVNEVGQPIGAGFLSEEIVFDVKATLVVLHVDDPTYDLSSVAEVAETSLSLCDHDMVTIFSTRRLPLLPGYERSEHFGGHVQSMRRGPLH